MNRSYCGDLPSDVVRHTILVILMLALFDQLWASSEIPISLPTTITCYAEQGTRRVIGGSCIMVSDGGDSYRTPMVESPFMFEGEGYHVLDVRLSIDGNYVYVAGGRGLYRCDLKNKSWKDIRPVGTRASSPAIAVGPDGTLYAGFGLAYYTASYTGLFRSTDSGESWVEMELEYDSAKVSPSVSYIVVSPSGRVFITAALTKGSGTSTFIYEVLPDGKLLRRGSNGPMLVHNNVVSSYTISSVTFGNKPGDTSRRDVFYFPKDDTVIRGAVAWPNDDTILVMVEQNSRFTALLMLEGRITRSIDLGATVNGSDRPWIEASSVGSRKSIIFSGLGRNIRMYIDTEEAIPLDFPQEYPIVVELLCTRDWGIARVLRHGWYRFNSAGLTRYDSAVSRSASVWMSNELKLSRRLIVTNYGSRIFEVSASGIDTLLKTEPYTSINSADMNEESEELYWALDTRVFRTNLETAITDTLTLNGWPEVKTGLTRQPFAAYGVAAFDGRVFAWASSSTNTSEAHAMEGLYEYADSVWTFVRGSTDGQRTRMIASARNDSTMVFSVADDLGSIGFSAPSVMMMRSGDTAAVVCPMGEIAYYDLTSLTTFGNGMLLATSADKLYRMVPEELPVEIDLGTKVFRAVEMDKFIAVSTEARGVVLIPKSDLVTTVEDVQTRTCISEYAEAYPNPVEQGKPLAIRLPQCCAQPVITIVDLLGRSFQSTRCDVGALVGGDARIETSGLTPGHYLLRLSGPTCTHVVPIRVTR